MHKMNQIPIRRLHSWHLRLTKWCPIIWKISKGLTPSQEPGVMDESPDQNIRKVLDIILSLKRCCRWPDEKKVGREHWTWPYTPLDVKRQAKIGNDIPEPKREDAPEMKGLRNIQVGLDMPLWSRMTWAEHHKTGIRRRYHDEKMCENESVRRGFGQPTIWRFKSMQVCSQTHVVAVRHAASNVHYSWEDFGYHVGREKNIKALTEALTVEGAMVSAHGRWVSSWVQYPQCRKKPSRWRREQGNFSNFLLCQLRATRQRTISGKSSREIMRHNIISTCVYVSVRLSTFKS